MTRPDDADPRIEAVADRLCGIEGNAPHTANLFIYRSMAAYVLEAADEAAREVEK